MVYTIKLNWLTFNVNLTAAESAIKALAPDCCGTSGVGLNPNTLDPGSFQIHFPSQPTDAEIAAIQAYWAALTPSSAEATSYQSAAQIQAAAAAAQAANLASATSKLTALGLTAAEIAAITGG